MCALSPYKYRGAWLSGIEMNKWEAHPESLRELEKDLACMQDNSSVDPLGVVGKR